MGGPSMGEGVPIATIISLWCDTRESGECAVLPRLLSVSLSHGRDRNRAGRVFREECERFTTSMFRSGRRRVSFCEPLYPAYSRLGAEGFPKSPVAGQRSPHIGSD